MIRVPDDCEARDIPRWLSGIFVDVNGTPYYFSDSVDGRVFASKVRGGDGSVVEFDKSECYAHWPKLGSFNLSDPVEGKGNAVHLSIRTQRQWNRTYNSDMLVAKRLDALPGREYMRSADFLRVPYVHAPYLTFEEAVKQVRGGTSASVAVNRRVAVGLGICTYKLAVFLDGNVVGNIVENSVVLFPKTDSGFIEKSVGGSHVIKCL